MVNKIMLLGIAGAGILALTLKGKASGNGGGNFPPPGTSLGDVDGDGIVSKADADLVAAYSVGNVQLTQDQHDRADVNCDGIVNIVDALLIAQYAEGNRVSFPCGES